MKTSKIQLASYSIPSYLYFPTRSDRDNYFIAAGTPADGTYCAVAENSGVDQSDTTSALWYLEVFNGANWTLASIDDNFALVITNSGLKALTIVQSNPAMYRLIVTRVVLRKTPFTASGTSPINYTDTFFRYDNLMQGNNPNLTILDTFDSDINPTFSMSHNISYRINMANGGIQYIISLDTDTLGLDYANMTSRDNPIPLSSYNVGAIGLYVEDPEHSGHDILFATANMTKAFYKYATTATNTGNTVKLYLNTTLSNLGYVSDLTVMPEDTGSIPEVVSTDKLPQVWNGTTAPHNIFLIDNHYNTGVPALAVRQGDPVLNQDINWTYFTPNSDIIKLNPSLVAGVDDYTVVYYDSSQGKYVPATETSIVQGIKLGNNLITYGNIINNVLPYRYIITPANSGSRYEVGDYFEYTDPNTNTEFLIIVTEVTAQGSVRSFTYSPEYGGYSISGTSITPYISHTTNGYDFTFNIVSNSVGSAVIWNFPQSALNSPLYVDANNPGELSTTPSQSGTVVGWCTGYGYGTSSIKLNIDTTNRATTTNYGTVRYATDNEVKKGNAVSGINTTVVCPEELQAHYLQKTLVSGEPGETAANPVVIDTNCKFTKQIVSTVSGVGFQGTAYRAEWADLAEMYESDQVYLPGTLITIGAGIKEITIAREECNGIISTKPGYILGEKKNDNYLPVALVGKVPVRFSRDSKVHFGDRVYLSKTEPGKASVIPYGKCLGKVIDKSEDLSRKSTIMCSIRINF